MKKYICLFILLVFSIPSMALSYSDDFEQRVEKNENNHTWRELRGFEGKFSYVSTLLTMCENFEIIQAVQKGEIKYHKLKRILNHFDHTIREKGRTKKVFIELYEYLNYQIPEGKETDGSMDIIKVLKNGGDCNDISPAFYSLFKYYGFNVYVIAGNSHNIEKNKDVLHAWLGVEFKENKVIELDALWYEPYYELNRMKKTNIIPFGVKDEYIITRKLK